MKIMIYVLLLCSFVASCGDDTVGYLDATAARYDPDYMTIRNCPMFVEELGIPMSEFWKNYNKNEGDPTWERYLEDYTQNSTRYGEDTIPWVSPPIQCVLGTQPIFVTICDVTSPDGGDPAVFKQEVVMYGNGVLVMPKQLPLGTYMVSVKIENEGHSTIVKDVMKVIMKGIKQQSDPQ